METSLYRSLYEGYISKERNISTKGAFLVLGECIKQTSKELNISKKKVEENIFNLNSISKASLKVPLDTDIFRKIYDDYINNYNEKDRGKSLYYDGNYISYNKVLGTKLVDPDRFLLLTLTLLDRYKYIDPLKLTDKSYIARLNNLGLPSTKWIKEQEIYSMNLSFTDTLIVRIYTGQGASFVNSYLREDRHLTPENLSIFKEISTAYKKAFFKYYEEKTMKLGEKFTMDKMLAAMSKKKYIGEFAEFFALRLDKIIYESPVVDKEFIVYRGKSDLSRLDKKEDTYISKGFSSTTINKFVALSFSTSTREEFSYLEKIIIPCGSHGLWAPIHGISREDEIILPDSSQFRVLEECQYSTMFRKHRMRNMKHEKEHLSEIEERMSLPEKIFSYLKETISPSNKDFFPDPMKGKLCLVEHIPKIASE